MKTYIYRILLLVSVLIGITSCRDREEPSEADMNDTIEGPSILKETDDASTYMSDTNRVTVEDSAKNADRAIK